MLFSVLGITPPSNMWDESDKIAFSIGSFTVAWYGIFMLIGFILAIFAAVMKLWKWYKVPVDAFYWFCLMGIPTAILGARFWSCCLGDAKWHDFFDFKTGGMAIEGGVVLTVLLACWWFPFILKRPSFQIRDLSKDNKDPVIRRVSMWVYADAIIPCILLGQVVGRWGNYFNQELYGPVVTNETMCSFLQHCLPWMYVANDNAYRQPLFLYESFANFCFFFIIYFGIECIPTRKAGDLGIIYFLWYGVLRMCMEPFREKQFTFTSTYVMTGIWIAVALVLLVLNEVVFPKLRHYQVYKYCFLKSKNRINLAFTKLSLKSNQKKLNSVSTKLSQASSQEEIATLNDLKKTTNDKVYYLQKKLDRYNQESIDIDKITYRNDNQMLYYRNK